MSNYKKQAVSDKTDKALELFADMMIKKIESVGKDWKKPWFTEGVTAWARNLSGREYNGMNAFMLMLLCEQNGYKHPIFCTFDRAVGLNYVTDKYGKKKKVVGADGKELPRVSVNKGEKSFPVFITTYKVINKETKETVKYEDYKNMSSEEQDKCNVYPKLQMYSVFNIDQTNLADARPELYAKVTKSAEQVKPMALDGNEFAFPEVDMMIEDQKWICPIKTRYGDSACYRISANEIIMPEKRQFVNGESFYGNLFHEMAHSTGAESCLNRLKKAPFGSPEYAMEELVAEMTAALCSHRYGMEKTLNDDSAKYLKSWLSNLRAQPTIIKTILLDVKKASSIITKKVDELQSVECCVEC